MGKVRPSYIKNTARRLLELYPDKFTTDFNQNKKLISELTNITSKRVRNRVAGYITRLVKLRQREEAQQ
ncbi:MAG: 30S ribosomal protein S17e [Thermofilum sp. ex4484_15]|nr:MAG: 30S ribosomal protein S17e [Thermofilum sp. ex4484_15]